MSLIFAEGFENYGTSGRPPFYKYSANTNAIHNTLTTGRFHGYGWRMGATFSSTHASSAFSDRCLVAAFPSFVRLAGHTK